MVCSIAAQQLLSKPRVFGLFQCVEGQLTARMQQRKRRLFAVVTRPVGWLTAELKLAVPLLWNVTPATDHTRTRGAGSLPKMIPIDYREFERW